MQPLSDQAARSAAREVLMCLHQHGEDGRGQLESLPRVERGLSVLAGLLPALAEPVRTAARAAAEASMRWGQAHGDFHSANLLWHDGAPKLIDFDCVRAHSPQAFDWMYFDVEHAAQRDALPWLRVVSRRLRDGEPGALERSTHDICLDRPGLWLLFTLDRVGQGAEFGVQADQDELGDAMTIALARWQADPSR
jgi:hypothetical protein